MRTLIKDTLKWIDHENSLIRNLSIFTVFLSALTVVVPVIIQAITNTVIATALPQPIIFLSISLGIAFVGIIFLKAIQSILFESFHRKIFSKHVLSYTDAVGASKETFFEINSLPKNCSVVILDGVSILIQSGIGLLLLMFYHPYFLIYAAMIIFSAFTLSKRGLKEGLQLAKDLSKKKYDAYASIGSKPEIETSLQTYLDVRNDYFRHIYHQRISFWVLQGVGTVTLIFIGFALVLKEQLSIGQLVAAELLAAVILDGVGKLGRILENLYELNASLYKVSQAVPLMEEVPPVVILNPIEPKTLRLGRRLIRSLPILFILFCLLPWVQTSLGTGRVIALSPDERPQQIDSPVEGRVKQWFVTEGSIVKKGDKIVELEDNDPKILDRLASEREAIVKRVEAARVGTQTSKKNIERQKLLFEQGLSSERTVELARLEYVRHLTDEANASAELSRIDVRISRQSTLIITAPKDGVILKRAQGPASELHKSGDILAVIVPNSESRIVELFVSGLDLPLIRVNQPVRIQFEGWPAIQFSGWPSIAVGTFGGVVQNIDAFDDGRGLFRIMVKPSEGEEWPNPTILRQGIRAKGWVRLNSVPLAFEIWRKLNGFPVSLPHEAMVYQSSKESTNDEKAKK